MKSATVLRMVVLLLTACFATSLLQAQGLDALRARMEERLPAVNALKDRHVVGETNRGYMEARGGVLNEEQQVISEENTDRRKVYAAIAAQTGASIDDVGRQRAEQIYSIARRGHWVQERSGDWRQK